MKPLFGLIATVFNIIVCVAIIGFTAYHFKKMRETDKEIERKNAETAALIEKKKPKKRLFSEPIHLIVANDSPDAKGDNRVFVRVSFTLETTDERVLDALKVKLPQIKEAVTELINLQPRKDLLESKFKDHLKDELISTIEDLGLPSQIDGLYFSSFSIGP